MLRMESTRRIQSEKMLPFECNICNLNFTNQGEQDIHVMGHFNQRHCTACDKLLIKFGSRWYEMKPHIDAECQSTDALAHRSDFHMESIKIEQIDLEPTEIPSEMDDETYTENSYDSVSVSEQKFKVENVEEESDSDSEKAVSTIRKTKKKPGKAPKVQPYICDYCDAEFDFKKDILKHIRLTHSNHQDYFVCDICGKSFNDKSNLFIHKTSHDDAAVVRCHICSETFKDKFELKDHRTKVHISKFISSEFTCELCEKSFKLEIALTKHKKKEHKLNNPYKCSECNESFSNKVSLNTHYYTHLNTGIYSCTQCDKKFQHKSTLINHINRIHAGYRPDRFNCDKCDKTFARRFELINHRLVVHEGKRLFECESCGHNCINKQSLKMHKRSHLSTKLFVCHLCGEGFNSQHILNRHITTHSGKRPYPCDLCGKAFTRQEHLKRHSRIHTGERLYNCDVGDCSRSYVNAADLEQHKYTVHGIQFKRDGFVCSVCSKAYVQKSLLKKHMQSHV